MPFIKIGDNYLNTDHIVEIYDDGTAIEVTTTRDKGTYFNYGADALRRWLAENSEELELRDEDEPAFEPGEEVIVNGVPHYVVRYHGGERITVVPAQHVVRVNIDLVSGIGDEDNELAPPVERKFKAGDKARVLTEKRSNYGKVITVEGYTFDGFVFDNAPDFSSYMESELEPTD